MKKLIIKLIGITLLSFLFVFLFLQLISMIKKEKIDSSYLWNISYENLTFTKGSKEGIIYFGENSLTLNTTFEEEEEFYEFEIDMVNKGSLSAEIKEVNIKIDNDQNVLKTEISYDNKEELKVGDILKRKERKKIRIKISYPRQEKKKYEALHTKISFQITFSSVSEE